MSEDSEDTGAFQEVCVCTKIPSGQLLKYPIDFIASHPMSELPTRYCYSCARFHPESEMQQVNTKTGKRWRCLKSIKNSKTDVASRDEFGRENSQANVFWSSTKPRINP